MENTKHIDREVKQLYRRFKLKNRPTQRKIKNILEKLGYTTHPYTREHIKAFDKRIPPAYTIESNDKKLVLYNKSLSEKDLTIAFAHELAHITLCHSHRHDTPDDTSTYQDYEANVFVYRFLNYKYRKRRYNLLAITFIAALITLTAPSYFIRRNNTPDISTTETNPDVVTVDKASADATNEADVVITTRGTVYHKPTCFYVKYKTNTITITEAEAIQLCKEPCEACFSEKQKK